MVTPLLAAEDVRKVYAGGTQALRGVSLAVGPGTVHGLIGANGAGKSTLIKIVSGVEPATGGTLRWRGEPAAWDSPAGALAAGLATVHQHTPLVGSLSVLDNVFLGTQTRLRWDAGAREAELARLCERVGYTLDARRQVDTLSVGARQMVAILQALTRDPALVLLDEPTAALSPTERAVLFAAIRRLRGQGTAFIYVSHFLDEILELTDQLTVLRDGRVVADRPTAGMSKPDLVTAIVGARLAAVEEPPEPAARQGEPLLEVAGLGSPGRFGPVDLTVRAGEVVGLAGLLGSGRTELLEAIFGTDRSATGVVRVAGRALSGHSPRAGVRAGLALVPEDRARQGLLRDWSLTRNVSLPYLPSLSWRRLLPDRRREEEIADRAVADLGIVTGSTEAPVGSLSGGNAQKVVFAKWLYGPAKVFLLDEPSAGVDVGAKADIIGLIRRLAAAGKAVLIVASEFEELLGACDRVLVLRRGRLTAQRRAADTSLHELTALASGL
ncbi:sugar ABC transporter ATP-binding protein [Amycolatopsis saalfeldensis]|uniref:Ribose transport system ATP-binding protein n=1 Tax=Amycolatopsis saalfeldensis TaxID=394193 RepID=A0A1H8VWS8_9PSEU|nr:sugar ABC transporter ATP-binding protein [Amycolatopsis saalfeldensis]SEP19795.1 ribose transport system ATP-binding protein [Amycolatopsis saalfeldensis]